MIRVIIGDDHPLVRAGLKLLLEECADIEFAAEVENGKDLLNRLREDSYDVAVVDMIMPGRSGIELIKQIKSEHPQLPVIVLSTHKEDIYALRTLKAGAASYICKDYTASDLVDAIRKVASGGRYISPSIAELMAADMTASHEDKDAHTLLSDREYQVFLLVASGMTTTDVGNKLSLSVKTVSTHKARIKEKMKISNDSEFVRYALKHQLLSETDK